MEFIYGFFCGLVAGGALMAVYHNLFVNDAHELEAALTRLRGKL